jgi:CheY-like chemotaxis protein
MTDDRRRRLVIVDDVASVRRGLALELKERGSGDLEIETHDFEQAIARTDYDDVDYVILDLSRSRSDDESIHEYPSFFVVDHIRTNTRGRGPWVIMVTGETAAHDSSVVNRMVADLGVDYFIERTSLESQLDTIFTQTTGRGIPAPVLTERSLRDMPAVVIPELGVSGESSLPDLHRFMMRDNSRPSLGKGGGSDHRRRTVAETVGRIFPVSSSGKPLRAGRGPTNIQLQRLKRALTRLPRPGRDQA